MPFGLGLHPWFGADEDTTLQFHARSVWFSDPDGAPTDRLRIPPELDFAAATTLPGYWRLLCYGGWSNTATITWPQRGVRLTIDADKVFGHLQLYSDPRRPALCVEPQTNVASALALIDAELPAYDLGLTILRPGERLTGEVRFLIETLADNTAR